MAPASLHRRSKARATTVGAERAHTIEVQKRTVLSTAICAASSCVDTAKLLLIRDHPCVCVARAVLERGFFFTFLISRATCDLLSIFCTMESLCVGVRIRPLAASGRERGTNVCATVTVPVFGEGSPSLTIGAKSFDFENLFDGASTQREIFDAFGAPHTESVLDGLNSTIFASGQTGSGKTHTVIGDAQRPGLLPLSCTHLFDEAARRSAADGGDATTVQFTISAQCFQIYEERVYDMLSTDEAGAECEGAGLRVRHNKKSGVFIEGITTVEVGSAEAAIAVFAGAASKRAVSATNMNAQSSRSHCIFKLIVKAERENADNGITRRREACLNLVDLAGSERIKSSGVAGSALKEAKSINSSLSELSTVIRKLDARERGVNCHIPYRNSKLTFLLRDSLGGNARTSLIATISPSEVNVDETLSTLRFACHAKNVKTKPIVAEEVDGTKAQLQAEIAKLRRENDRLFLSAEAASGSSSAAAAGTPAATPRAGGRLSRASWGGSPVANAGGDGDATLSASAGSGTAADRIKNLSALRSAANMEALENLRDLRRAECKCESTEQRLAELTASLDAHALTLKMIVKLREARIAELAPAEPSAAAAFALDTSPRTKSETLDFWAEVVVPSPSPRGEVGEEPAASASASASEDYAAVYDRLFRPTPLEVSYRTQCEMLSVELDEVKAELDELRGDEGYAAQREQLSELRATLSKATAEMSALFTENSELVDAGRVNGDRIVDLESEVEERRDACVALELALCAERAALAAAAEEAAEEEAAMLELTESLTDEFETKQVEFEAAAATAATAHAAALAATEAQRNAAVRTITAKLVASSVLTATLGCVSSRQAESLARERVAAAARDAAAADAERSAAADTARLGAEVATLTAELAAASSALAAATAATEDSARAIEHLKTISAGAEANAAEAESAGAAMAAELVATATALDESHAARAALEDSYAAMEAALGADVDRLSVSARALETELIAATAKALGAADACTALELELLEAAQSEAALRATVDASRVGAAEALAAERARAAEQRAAECTAAEAREAEMKAEIESRTEQLTAYAAQLAQLQSHLSDFEAEIEAEHAAAESRVAAQSARADAAAATLAEFEASVAAHSATRNARVAELEAQVDDGEAMYKEACAELETQRNALVGVYTAKLAEAEERAAAEGAAAAEAAAEAAAAATTAAAATAAAAAATEAANVAMEGAATERAAALAERDATIAALEGERDAREAQREASDDVVASATEAARAASDARVQVEAELVAASDALVDADAAYAAAQAQIGAAAERAAALEGALAVARAECDAAAEERAVLARDLAAARAAPVAADNSAELAAAVRRVAELEAQCSALEASASLSEASASVSTSTSRTPGRSRVESLRDENARTVEKLAKRLGKKSKTVKAAQSKRRVPLGARTENSGNVAASATAAGKGKRATFEAMTYRDLQAAAKRAGVKANGSKGVLLQRVLAAQQ